MAVRVAAAVAVPEARRTTKKPTFPFVRLAGQDDMKLALLLNVVDPNIGGVLIMGDRGTGKSVAVRSLVDLLPEIDVVVDDPFNSHPTDPKLMGPEALLQFRSGKQLPATKARTPLVELPLGATEDRICGTIDIEKALSEGIKVSLSGSPFLRPNRLVASLAAAIHQSSRSACSTQRYRTFLAASCVLSRSSCDFGVGVIAAPGRH